LLSQTSKNPSSSICYTCFSHVFSTRIQLLQGKQSCQWHSQILSALLQDGSAESIDCYREAKIDHKLYYLITVDLMGWPTLWSCALFPPVEIHQFKVKVLPAAASTSCSFPRPWIARCHVAGMNSSRDYPWPYCNLGISAERQITHVQNL
jgi:hypothetical protein